MKNGENALLTYDACVIIITREAWGGRYYGYVYKKALAAALKKMMEVKPIDKITVKDLVEICG